MTKKKPNISFPNPFLNIFFVTRYVPKIYVNKFSVQLNNKICCHNIWSFYCCKAEKTERFKLLFFLEVHKNYFDHAMVDTTTIYAQTKKNGQILHKYDLQFKLRIITNPPR